jgi:mycothiol synthase
VTPVRWRTELSAAEQDAVRDLVSGAELVDGPAPVGEQVLRELPHGRTGHLLVADPQNEHVVLGYLNLVPGRDGTDAVAELVVDPAARRRGIGAGLARAAIERSGGRVRFWAHGTLPAAHALAGSLHLRVARELVQMRRPLSDVPEAVAPSGVRIRAYTGPEDDAELLRVNNAAFSWHPEQGGWTLADLGEHFRARWFDPAGLFLAFDDVSGALVGFHWTKIHDGHLGEVYVLGVDPAAHGRGLGRVLTLVGLSHLARRLASSADSEVMLYVESDNSAAIRTYQGLGFAVAGVDTAYATVQADAAG